MVAKEAKSVVLVNGEGVRVRVDDGKVAALRSTGFRRPGGRPAVEKATAQASEKSSK